jgi:type IV pilus assembly protein PilM
MVLGTARFVALDSASVSALAVAGGLGGRRVAGHSRVLLPAGALLPGAVDDNLADAEVVREAVREAAAKAGLGSGPVTLVLPGASLCAAVAAAPRGADPREFARFRLGAHLPYPASEAVCEAVAVPGGRLVLAAVRRSVLDRYERLLTEAGLRPGRVDVAPLAWIGALAGAAGPGLLVDVVLDDASAFFVAAVDGVVSALRRRLRDRGPEEGARLLGEARRTAASLRADAPARLRFRGREAPGLVEGLGASRAELAPPAQLAGLPAELAHAAWLGAVVA